jgi:hypothetical protein
MPERRHDRWNSALRDGQRRSGWSLAARLNLDAGGHCVRDDPRRAAVIPLARFSEALVHLPKYLRHPDDQGESAMARMARALRTLPDDKLFCDLARRRAYLAAGVDRDHLEEWDAASAINEAIRRHAPRKAS